MVVCNVVVDITAGTSASLLQWPEVGQWQRSLLGGACLAPNLMPIFTTSSVQGSKMGGQLSPALWGGVTTAPIAGPGRYPESETLARLPKNFIELLILSYRLKTLFLTQNLPLTYCLSPP